MVTDRLLALILGVIFPFFTTAFWCALVQPFASGFAAAEIAAVPTGQIRYVGAAHDGLVVVSHGTTGHGFSREIVQSTAEGNSRRLRLELPRRVLASTIPQPRGSDGFAVTTNGWWYATLDDRGGAAAVTFVKSDGSRGTHVRENVSDQIKWSLVTIPGEEPRALEIVFPSEGQDETVITELEWAGATRSWRLHTDIGKWSTVAARLPAGSIALLSGEHGLSMSILSDDGAVQQHMLRNSRVRQLAGAVDPDGNLAIAVAYLDRPVVEVTIMDPLRPDMARWHQVPSDELVVGRMRLAVTPAGFIAAWVNDRSGRRIEAVELPRHGRSVSVPLVIGGADYAEAFFDMQATDEELLVWWRSGTQLVERRLPLSLTAYAFLHDVAELACDHGQ